MTAFASNNFNCTVDYMVPPGTELTSEPATIACGLDGAGALAATNAGPTQITGDPEADGFFKIGSSTQLGTYVRKTAGDSIAEFDLYVTSFIWSDSISPVSGGSLQDPSVFENGDLVIGVGLKSSVANDRANTGLKVDPFNALETYRPSTVVDVDSNGMGSTGGGQCAVGRFNLQVQNTKGLYDVYKQCDPTYGERFDITTATAEASLDPPVLLLPGNWFETDDDTGFEILFKPDDIATFQETVVPESFEAGWKFVMYGYFSGPLQTDAVGFGLPLSCPAPTK